jgi:SAM-dependent methyltransferase
MIGISNHWKIRQDAQMSKSSDYYEEFWKIGGHGGEIQGYFKNMLRWLDRELPLEQPLEHILEAGCGGGAFTPHLAKRAAHMRACDISATQIAANCKAWPDISFFVQDLGKPVAAASGTFDAVWCSEVLEHLFDPAFALNEFYRVLKPGGNLLITVPYHGLLKNVMIALFKWNEHFAPNGPHIRFFTVKMITRLVKKAGFRNIHAETCGMNKPLRDLLIPTNILLTAKK